MADDRANDTDGLDLPEDWEDDLYDEDGPEGLDDLFTLAPLIPTRLLLPVMERLGLSPREALNEPWRESQSPSYYTLAEAILESGNPDLIREVIRAAASPGPLGGAGEVMLRRTAEKLNAIGDPQLAGVAVEVYLRADATAAARHALARGPLGNLMVEPLLGNDGLSSPMLRPLLATGNPEVALRVLALPPGEVSREEQAEAAMVLLELGRAADLGCLLRSVSEHGTPGAHISAELREAFSNGLPDGPDDPRVDRLRCAAMEAGTAAHLSRLLVDHLTTQPDIKFLLHSPHLHDIQPLIGLPLPREVRRQMLHKIPDCPPEIGLSLLDHRDAADEMDAVLKSPCQASTAAPPHDVVRHTAPVPHLVSVLDPTRDWKYHGYGLRSERGARGRLNAALGVLLEDASPEALLGGARMAPGFDGTLPELLAAGEAHAGTDALEPEGIELLHLLLHFAPARTTDTTLPWLSAEEALGLARHAALWLSEVPTNGQDEDADLQPYRSLLCAIARTRTDSVVREALAGTCIRAVGDAGMDKAGKALLTALETGDVPGVREQAERHLPDATAWLAEAEVRRKSAQEANEPPDVGLVDVLAEELPRRIWRAETTIVWDDIITHYQGRGRLAPKTVNPLLHRPDLPAAMHPLLLGAHPELRNLPSEFGVRHPRLPPRWLLPEVLPHWEQVGDMRLNLMMSMLTAGLVGAEELLGKVAPARDAASALEEVQTISSINDLAPRCRELISVNSDIAVDVDVWAAAVHLLADFPGTLVDLLTTAAMTAATTETDQH